MDAKTWNKLMVLGSKQGSIKLSDLASQLEYTEQDTLDFIKQLFPEGNGILLEQKADGLWLQLDASSIQYLLPLTPSEWKQLDQLINHAPLETFQHKAFQSLKSKVTDQGPIQVVMDMLDQLQIWEMELSAQEQQLVNMLDDAVTHKRLLKVGATEKTYHIFPCKVLHLEGQLSLIAEDFQDHCLMVFPVKQIKEATIIPSGSQPRVSAFELEEFIGCIRAMNEKETRLILKIYDSSSVNLFPDHHFLGKPCMVTNPNGDLIWAAYVEPCEALFDWVSSLGHHVEILDPTKFKDQYLSYCEEKLRKIA